MQRVRVLVVDDSAFARKVLREALGRSSRIEVVDVARDGLEALEKIQELRPDVVTLDLVMPNLDGLGVLRALPPDGPRVVVVSLSDVDSELGIEALQSGAFDLVHKPTALATDRLYELSDELVRKVLAAAAAARAPATRPPPAPMLAPRPAASPVEIVVVGTSTGGPQALTRLLTALPADFPVPIAIALHIPAGYTESLARRLDEASALEVVEAVDGMALRPGRAIIAVGGTHLVIERAAGEPIVRVDTSLRPTPYRPSVDQLFESAAAAFGPGVLGVVLTGMGDDGLLGARAIDAAGGRVVTEAESSCIVYGMPRSVREAGLSHGEWPLERMASALVSRCRS